MVNPVKHIVIDTNTLLAYLHPRTTDDEQLRERSRVLFDAVVCANWPKIRLYMPAICIAEAFVTLDKYRWCHWGKPLADDSAKALSPTEFDDACAKLKKLVDERLIEQLENEPVHVQMARLVSPINYLFKLDKASGYHNKRPMGTSDCMIAGMAIHLAHRLGRESVLLITNDYRLADVMEKSSKLSRREKQDARVVQRAAQVGMRWNKSIFPESIILSQVSERILKEVLGGWPLPNESAVKKWIFRLDQRQKTLLGEIWKTKKTYWDLKDPDRLPYTKAVQDIQATFAMKTSIYLTESKIFTTLVNMRKNSTLPK